jgi:hypothetical protein
MTKRLTFLLLIICFLAAGTAFAQVTPVGKIIGKVVDDQGTPLPGVAVEATSPKLVGKAGTVTDVNGTYRLMALPTGTYEITFSLSGFKKLIRQQVFLEMTQTLVLDAALEPAAVEEEVTVVGQSPLIDVKSTTKGQLMTKDIFLTLPRGRSFDSLVSTMPGVSNEDITAGITVDGATGAENMFYTDGADTTNFHLGTSGQNIVLELLDEVKVTASGYNAEFGGSVGGVVNIITRSGGNEFHGDVMLFYENNKQWMQGHSRDYLRLNPYDSTIAEYVNDDDLYYGGGDDRDKYYRIEGVFSLGGYFIKDRLWFFGSFNPVYYKTTAERDFNAREGPFSTYVNKNHEYNGSFKLSAAPANGLRLAASFVSNFTNYRGDIPSIDGTDNPTIPWTQTGYDFPNYSAALTADYTAGNNLLISYRGGWHLQNENNQQLPVPDGPTYYFYYSNEIYSDDPFYQAHPDLLHYENWESFPAPYYRVTEKYKQQKISNNIDVSYFANWMGEHALKAGFGYIYLNEDVSEIAPHPRVTLYFDDTNSNLGFDIGAGADPSSPSYGAYGWYSIRSGWKGGLYGGLWNVSANNFSVFAQDSWTIKGRLTVNFGLRAEGQVIPAMTTNTSYPGYKAEAIKFNLGDTLAPRLGVVYDVFGDSSLKVFGSFGIYYDVMKLYMAELTYGGWKRIEDYYALQDPDWTKIAASGDVDDKASQTANNYYAGSEDYLPPSFATTDPDLKPMAQREISFGAEKKLLEDLSLSARFVNKHLIRTIEDVGNWVTVVDPDTGTPTLVQQYWIANPGFGVTRPTSEGGLFPTDTWPCPKATRDYYGVNVALEKRFSHNWQGGLNYTWSRIEGVYSGLASTDEAGYDYAGVARLGANVEQDFDKWFMGYDALGNLLDGPLPQDRTHYIKAYGSYVFPFGLTVGMTAYGRSGLPQTTKVRYGNKYLYPNNRADLGRNPFSFWADLFLEYTYRFGDKYLASLNFQINNLFGISEIQRWWQTANRRSFSGYDDELLNGEFAQHYMEYIVDEGKEDPRYDLWEARYAPFSARLGLKFSF